MIDASPNKIHSAISAKNTMQKFTVSGFIGDSSVMSAVIGFIKSCIAGKISKGSSPTDKSFLFVRRKITDIATIMAIIAKLSKIINSTNSVNIFIIYQYITKPKIIQGKNINQIIFQNQELHLQHLCKIL